MEELIKRLNKAIGDLLCAIHEVQYDNKKVHESIIILQSVVIELSFIMWMLENHTDALTQGSTIFPNGK